jgi:hypothetical protein
MALGPGLTGGCAVSETDSTAAQEEPGTLGEFEQALGQTCSINDDCPRGTGCYNGTCIGIVQFGPVPAPPLSPACVSDGQCAPYGRRCSIDTTTFTPGGSYGYCFAPTCSVSWGSFWIPQNSTVDFTVTSNEMPGGSYSLLHGTRNGVIDENGSYYNLVSGVFPITNSPGLSGFYSRYVRMYAPDGRLFCTTNESYAYFY